jgi:hypothetical protein
MGMFSTQLAGGAGYGLSGAGALYQTLNGIPGAGIGYSGATGTFNYPNGPDGGLYVSPIWLHHNGAVRGYLKGLWAPVQDRPLNHGDTYSGSGNLAGKSFLSMSGLGGTYASGAASIPAQVHAETSSTWS